jgi:pimeloyl-ACP methyl ester carboxylesterase
MYTPLRTARSLFVPIRSHRYHLLSWGESSEGSAPRQTPLILLHGWMDVGASWQFVVDALAAERPVFAPDWRGFGQTTGPAADHYQFADYLADLDFLLDQLAPGMPVDLVGHSMGGNVATLYAGVRPQRIRRLVNLEGFGMPATQPADAPARLARWMDEIKALAAGEKDLRTYTDLGGVAGRLMKTNPRLTQDKAQWLAQHWAEPTTDGWRIRGDAAHKVVSPQIYRVEEAKAHFSAITAPTLVIEASQNEMQRWWGARYSIEEFHQRLEAIRDVRIARVEDAGHMLHHDQPKQVAELIEAFLR